MSKFDEIRENAGTRSKSLLVTIADILESVTRQNLAFASDFAGFAVAQVRLPTQADDMADYRSRSKEAYSEFGGALKNHGKDLFATMREVPGQIKDALTAEAKPARKPARKPAAKKKTAAKK